MKQISTLADYCRNIGISQPRHTCIDIRSFEENMATIKHKVAPFRHEFYAIALRTAGEGTTLTGSHFEYHGNKHTLFFNTPYQAIAWDIRPNWKGYYIIFTEDFIRHHPTGANMLNEFPFLRLDNSTPFRVEAADLEIIDMIFKNIYREYHHDKEDKMPVIRAYIYLLMQYVKRNFQQHCTGLYDALAENSTADVQLISRFQALIETCLYKSPETFNPHEVRAYAGQLGVHPNHLNAAVKRISGKTAKQLIHENIVLIARTLLTNTTLPVKEISFKLFFKEPTHFNAFFRKYEAQTPIEFRKKFTIE